MTSRPVAARSLSVSIVDARLSRCRSDPVGAFVVLICSDAPYGVLHLDEIDLESGRLKLNIKKKYYTAD